MYDFNPLATLYLLKAFSTDVRLPSGREMIRRVAAQLTRPVFRRPPVVETEPLVRRFERPANAARPSYNVQVRQDVPAR